MKIDLNKPTALDSSVIDKWVGSTDIYDYEQTNEDTLLVMTEDSNDNTRILRFFVIDGKTECSVDYDTNRREHISPNLVFQLLQRYFK